MAAPASDAGFSGTSQVGAVTTGCPLEKRNLVLIPRKKAHLYAPDNRLKDLLAPYPALCAGSPLKALEYKFYPDLNAERTITAILTEDPWNPNCDPRPALKTESISFELAEGAASDFKLSATSASGGEAEIKLTVLKLHKEDTLKDHSTVKIRAKAKDFTAELELTVHRNEDVGEDFAEVVGRRTLLVRQKKDWLTSDGVKALQRLINQVVARHKAVADFKWLAFDGQYGAGAAHDLEAFLEKFAGAFDYEKGHFNVAVEPRLIDYVKAEYGTYAPGDLVDRALLVGEEPWSEGMPLAGVDGMLDLYNGVVKRFFREMHRMAATYIDGFGTFWLHRAQDEPRTDGAELGELVVIADQPNVRKQPSAGSESLATVKRGQTLASEGETQKVGGKTWHKVKTTAGVVGWCSELIVRRVTNDREHEDNVGNYGTCGVCYSLGGKDLPERFSARLNANVPPPDTICTWYQYVSTTPDAERGAGEGQPGVDVDYQIGDWKVPITLPGNGCDCSGFTQNCITESRFPDNMRIVPQGLVQKIEAQNPPPALGQWPWSPSPVCIGANDFVDKHARLVPYFENVEEKQWLDETDVITNDNHVVWVADSRPQIKNKVKDRAFQVYNEYGSDKWFEHKNGGFWNASTQPAGKYVRKAIKMEFGNWGVKLTSTVNGRIYFWK